MGGINRSECGRQKDPFPFTAAGDASQSGLATRWGGTPVQAMSILTAEAAVPPIGLALVYALASVSSLVAHFQQCQSSSEYRLGEQQLAAFWVILISVLFCFSRPNFLLLVTTALLTPGNEILTFNSHLPEIP